MKKKLTELLQTKCKDFGLTENAIEDLVKTGIEGLKEDASDEDIEKMADSMVPYARMMQAEVTRKAQKRGASKEKTAETSKETHTDEEPDWFKAYREDVSKQLSDLKTENDTLKAERSKNERAALISKTATELGIPEYLMKHFALADDADVKKTLTEFKQELVTNKLLPAESADITSSSAEAAKDDAKAWAQSLPNN